MRISVIVLAILFGILSLAPNLQGGQFLRLSKVIEHYEQHQKSNQSFSSFSSFLQDHYFDNRKTSDDEKQLPFKSISVSNSILHLHECTVEVVHEKHTFHTKQTHFFGEPTGKIQYTTLSIWHPPQYC
jgi:hypothetical protein